MSLYEKLKDGATLCSETEYVRVYQTTINNKQYEVIVTKKRANGHTVIHCQHNQIIWEQVPLFPRFAGQNYGEKTTIYVAVPTKNSITIFVVRGRPDGFVGLDDGVFRCADNYDEHSINVMSHKRFKRM